MEVTLQADGYRAVAAWSTFRAEAPVATTREHHIPGMAFGLLAEGREGHASFAPASLAALAPVSPGTLFQIGSLSRTFTTTAVWHLIDHGVLTLGAPVRIYLLALTLSCAAIAAKLTIVCLNRA